MDPVEAAPSPHPESEASVRAQETQLMELAPPSKSISLEEGPRRS